MAGGAEFQPGQGVKVREEGGILILSLTRACWANTESSGTARGARTVVSLLLTSWSSIAERWNLLARIGSSRAVA